MPLEFYNLLFINYAGCQDGLVLDRMKQELSEVEKNLTDIVSKIIGQVSSDQTEQRRWLEKEDKRSDPGVKRRNKGFKRKPNLRWWD